VLSLLIVFEVDVEVDLEIPKVIEPVALLTLCVKLLLISLLRDLSSVVE